MAPAEQIIQAPALDEYAEQQRDLEANSFSAAQQHKREAETARKHTVTLAGENAAARYRKIVLCCPQVTDAECRVLFLIVEKADGDLKNSFASPAWMQRHLGGRGCKRKPTHRGADNGRRTLGAIYKVVASLERKKFLRWHKGNGWQLRLPENVLAPDADAWDGPADWSKRTPKGTY